MLLSKKLFKTARKTFAAQFRGQFTLPPSLSIKLKAKLIKNFFSRLEIRLQTFQKTRYIARSRVFSNFALQSVLKFNTKSIQSKLIELHNG